MAMYNSTDPKEQERFLVNEGLKKGVKKNVMDLYGKTNKHDTMKENSIEKVLLPIANQERVLRCIKGNGLLLGMVENQTPEICLDAVRQNGLAIAYVREQTDELCMEAIKENPNAIYSVRNQTHEMAMEAVRRDGSTIWYINEPLEDGTLGVTMETYMEAMKTDAASVLARMEVQTDEVCLAAVKIDPKVLEYVRNQTPEIVLEAVRMNPVVIQFADRELVTSRLCMLAVKTNPWSIKVIINFFPEMVVPEMAKHLTVPVNNYLAINHTETFKKLIGE